MLIFLYKYVILFFSFSSSSDSSIIICKYSNMRLKKNHVFFSLAVVFHHGKNATGGHYTAVTYEQATNSWSLKDDTSVTPIEESTFLNYSIENNKNIMPYFLIYRQRLTFSHNGTDAY